MTPRAIARRLRVITALGNLLGALRTLFTADRARAAKPPLRHGIGIHPGTVLARTSAAPSGSPTLSWATP